MSHGFTEMQANRPLCLGHHRKLSVCVLFGRRKLSTCALSCTCFPWTKGWPLPELQETPSENVPQSSTGRRLPLAESLHRLCATAGSCFRKGPRLFPLVPSLQSCRIPSLAVPHRQCGCGPNICGTLSHLLAVPENKHKQAFFISVEISPRKKEIKITKMKKKITKSQF